MRAVGRLFADAIAFIAAVIAAALFLLAARVGLEPTAPGEEWWFWGNFFVYGAAAASMLGAAAFLPWLVLAVVTEMLSIRSLIVHVGAGGLFGLLGSLRLGGMQARMSAQDLGFGGDATLLVAAGFIGGFVYWLFAGRMAGLRPLGRDPEGSPPEPRP